MSNLDTQLKEAMQIAGAIGVALVDYESGMALGTLGGGGILDMDIAAAGNTEVVRAKMAAAKALGLTESIEDILITLDTQIHLIRLCNSKRGQGLFLYLALTKDKSNLAMARRSLSTIENDLVL
jgi:hypothetical protein